MLVPKFLRPEVLAFASVEILHARLTDTEPILQTICAWHTPKPELDRLNAAYPGQISHGICDDCAAKQEIA